MANPIASGALTQQYVLTYPQAAGKTLIAQWEESFTCPILCDNGKMMSLVPCGHPIGENAVQSILQQGICPACRGVVLNCSPNWGMRQIQEQLPALIDYVKWSSAALQAIRDEEARRAPGQPQTPAREGDAAEVSFHVMPAGIGAPSPTAVALQMPYPGEFSRFSYNHPWAPLERAKREEYRTIVRCGSFKDVSQNGCFSYIRFNGAMNGRLSVMVLFPKNGVLEVRLKEAGVIRPESENKDGQLESDKKQDKKAVRTTIVGGMKVEMGRCITDVPEHMKYLLQLVGTPYNMVIEKGQVIPMQHSSAYKFFQQLVDRPCEWPAVEAANTDFYEEGYQLELAIRTHEKAAELAKKAKGNAEDVFKGYSEEELQRATALQRKYEAEKADEEYARQLAATLD